MRTWYGLLAMGGILLALTGCENSSGGQDDILSVKERHEAKLMAIPGVVGVGIGERNGKECIVVMVERETPQTDRDVPKELEGHPVVVEVTGPIGALPAGKSFIEGRITALNPKESRILVEENPRDAYGSAKASLRVTAGTRILLRRTYTPGEFSDLRVGYWAQAWVTGPIAESYPVQGAASTILYEP